MKKVIVSLASLVISLVLCGTARAQAHRNAYGGSHLPQRRIQRATPMPTVAARRTRPVRVQANQRIWWHQYVARLRWGHDAIPTPTVAPIMRKGLERRLPQGIWR